MQAWLERALIDRATPSHRERSRISLFAFFQGWAAAQVISFAYCAIQGVPRVEDDELALSWWQTWLLYGLGSLLFGALGWAFSLGPVSLFVRTNGALSRAWVAPFFGAAVGVAAFRAEQVWLLRSQGADVPWLAFACAACIGAVGWGSNAWMLRRAGST
jgi:hypothetical protein